MKHKCVKCNKIIVKQLAKHWICIDCKRKKEVEYYHKCYKKQRSKQNKKRYRKFTEEIKAHNKIITKLRQQKLRDMALTAYGNKCVCCEEDKKEFLCVDHVNGGGNQHRKLINGSFFLYLFRMNYPKKEFRILCQNCNSSMGHYGYCPHQSALKIKEGERYASSRMHNNG